MTKAQKNSKTGAAGQAADKFAKSGENKNPQIMGAMETEDGHIDKIRDILFGRQMADYEKRFKQLEDRITSQIDALRQESDGQLKTIKDLFQKQNDQLTERLKDEQSERGQEGKALSREIARAEKAFSKAIDTLSAQQTQDVASLREQLSALSNELSDELHIQQIEAARNLEQAAGELDDAKLARTALSQMLMEMAGRLSDAQD